MGANARMLSSVKEQLGFGELSHLSSIMTKELR
jgi:hypothetical protein